MKPKKQDISITKGNSYRARLTFKDYTPGSSDVIRFAVKKSERDTTKLYSGTVSPTEKVLYIPPDKTDSFPSNSDKKGIWGTYPYDVKLVFSTTDNRVNDITFLKGTLTLYCEVSD